MDQGQARTTGAARRGSSPVRRALFPIRRAAKSAPAGTTPAGTTLTGTATTGTATTSTVLAVTVLAVTVLTGTFLAVAGVPGAPGATAWAAPAEGAAVSCTNTDPILGPLKSSATMPAGTTGFLQLGSPPNGGKFTVGGTCALSGTVPAGWKVAEGSWVSLSATSGSGNAGTFIVRTGDSTFTDSGIFTNSGTFEDGSNGLTQGLYVEHFVNKGTVASDGGAFGTDGTTANPPCPKCTFADYGTVDIAAKQTFGSGSIFVLEPGGKIEGPPASFGINNESTFEVLGGTVAPGTVTTTQFLGQGASTIEFAATVPPASRGTIDVSTGANLKGVIPKHWTLDNSDGSIAASNSGNKGTFIWTAGVDDVTLSDATPFVNSGSFTDDATGFSQQLEVPRFVNNGTFTSNAPGFGVGGNGFTPVFVDNGTVRVGAKGGFGATGVFDLNAGGTVLNQGGFGLSGVTLNVGGGSISGKPATALYHLGASAVAVKFETPMPAASHGNLTLGLATTLTGVIPRHWTVNEVGGPGAAITAVGSGNDGTLTWAANAALTSTGTFRNSGVIDLTNGSVGFDTPSFVNAGGKVIITGDTGISVPKDFTNNGSFILGPGNKASVGGNYVQGPAGSLDLALGMNGTSLAVGSVGVGGDAHLGGALNFTKVAGFKPQVGVSGPIVTAHALSGRFGPVTGTGDGSGLATVVTYGLTSVTVEVSKAG